MTKQAMAEELEERAVKLAAFGFAGSSFRSEDSEVLALWEEKTAPCSPKSVSTDLSWLQKPRHSVDSSLSPWRHSFARKIESLFSRSSPVHHGESPRPSLEYLMKHGDGRKSSWRDFKIMSSPARSSVESSALHNSPKARYSNASLCRATKRTDHELMEVTGAVEAPRDASHEKSTTRGERDGFSGNPLMERRVGAERRISGGGVRSGHDAGLPPRSYSLNLPKADGTVSSSRRFSAVAPSEIRQCGMVGALPAALMERCGSASRARSQSMDEAMLNEFASEGGGVQQARQEPHEPVSRKPSHRYYQKMTSRERISSRWSSGDDTTPLDHIDFVAPSALRFLEEGDETLPVKSPVKPAGAVPFKWEQEPGKPAAAAATAPSPPGSPLQLPPRLALRKQHSSPLRERALSAPLAGLHQEAEPMKVQLPWIDSPASRLAKSRSAGDYSSSLTCTQRQPAQIRPASPTSILCGPCDGSHPSSLGSEQEAPPTFRGLSTCASFDSLMEQSSVSPESSLTSPLRANTRCNSIEHKMDIQKVASSENAFVKLCKSGKRWMTKSKTPHSNLSTIYSPEVWTPVRFVDRCEFSDRLDGAQIDHSRIQIISIESRFRPKHEVEVGDRSPAYAATLELLSPKLDRVSSKKQQKPSRLTKKTTSRLRVRARLRARFLVPMRRALRTLISRCTFRRRRNKNVKAPGCTRPLYHVDYTLTQGQF